MRVWKCFKKDSVPLATCCVVVSIPCIITGIMLGVKHFDECPAEPYIPLFLIVVNAAHSFLGLLLLLLMCCEFEECKAKVMMVLIYLVGTFILVWHIAGWVWLFPVWHSYWYWYPGCSDCCDYTLYSYTFSMEIIFMFLLVVLFVVDVCYGKDNMIDVVE